MKKRYIVRLTEEEREWLEELVYKGKAAAYRRTHAQTWRLLCFALRERALSTITDRKVML
ncbi:hypothetical protein [Nitrosomonas marina]|uniref:IS630 family transposase n=1 Tax=Nitrosomonas marina TaxID=917 RepID=A0A1H8BDC5_9PROT|nr:hypothetical protein [Nitrosomonas marina]SEM80756.1 hypothetical protein SAMN05216325_102216 [Nitrosomonas marina]